MTENKTRKVEDHTSEEWKSNNRANIFVAIF